MVTNKQIIGLIIEGGHENTHSLRFLALCSAMFVSVNQTIYQQWSNKRIKFLNFWRTTMSLGQIASKSITLNTQCAQKVLQNLAEQTLNQQSAVKKKKIAPSLIILLAGLSGCMIVDSPIKGVLGTEVIWGDVAGKNAEADTIKHGKACAHSILGLVAEGDASVRAAKENGGITEVSSVDHSARNLLNIVGEWCTLVRGK